MAENISESAWATNFYYGQELRSLYMNGALNSGFKPGIYNCSAALYTKPNTSPDSGLYLLIKKGTTFIFSNNYKKDKKGRWFRDLNEVGDVIIKSVALKDIEISLIGLGGSHTLDAYPILGNSDSSSASPASRFYIVARYIYSSNPSDGSLGSTKEPDIILYMDNPNFKSEIQKSSDLDSKNSLDYMNYYYVPSSALASSDNASSIIPYRIPDGSISYSGTLEEDMRKLCYLFLGEVIDTSMINLDGTSKTQGGYINQQGKWIGTAIDDDTIFNQQTGDNKWVDNHVFIGRGFPDYRQNLIANKDEVSPDIIPNRYLNEVALDLPHIYKSDILYNVNSNWKASKDMAREKDQPAKVELHPYSKKNRFNTYKMDFKVSQNNNKGLLDSSKEYIFYEKTPNSILNQINSQGLHFKSNSGSEEVLVTDVVMISTREDYSNIDPLEIYDIFTNGALDDSSEANAEKYYLHHRNMKLIPFRLLSSCDFTILDTRMDDETVRAVSAIRNEAYGLSQKIVPLDVGNINFKRLNNLIKNRNIIPIIMDYLRLHENESPYYNPVESTSVIPLALIFRKFTIKRNPEGKVIGLFPIDSISKDSDGINPGRYNPANIYSFLDMKYKTTQFNDISFTADKPFTVIPVIN